MTIHLRAGAMRLPVPMRRTTPVSLAIALALGGAGLGLAAGTASAAEAGQTAELDEVTVTGTRIRAVTGMDTPTPVAALSTTELEAMTPGNITEALTQLPVFYASPTAENFNVGVNGFFTSPGGGSLNLRGVGSRRTLTLLDGRRVVPASVYGGPDINLFPSELLRRVETVTGGASAAYGTDAVSGVINYILDTDFEGFRGRAQFGTTDRGDADSREYGLSVGHRLGERTHLLLSVEHRKQDAVESFDGRSWYKGCSLVRSPVAGAGGSQDNPLLVPACNLHAINGSFDGIITAAAGAGGPVALPSRMIFGSDGSLTPLQPGSFISSGFAGASEAQVGGGGTDNTSDRVPLSASTDRNNAFAYLDFDLSDRTNLYVQAMYSDQTLRNVNQTGSFYPGGVFQNFTIYAGNPYLGDPAAPGTAANWMQTNGITSFTLGRLGHSSDFGDSHVANKTETVSATAGFRSRLATGGFFNDWTLDGYYQYGVNDLDAVQENGVRVDRIYQAADAVVDPATGRVMCRVTQMSGLMPDCVPINLFGRGQASQAAIDWVTGFDPDIPVSVTPYLPGYDPETYSYVGDEDKHRLVKLKQHVFEFAASGQVAEGWAGPISAAFGAHYRKESVDQKVRASQGNPAADPFFYPAWCNDASLAAATPPQPCLDQVAAGTRPPGNIGVRGVPNGVQTNSIDFQFSKVPFIRGDFDIKEVFAETLVPLVSDAGWMQALNFQGAVRWADYAGSGNIWSYKGGLDAQVTDSFRLRGTYSRDVRAANIGERFDRTGGFANITDRIDPANPVTTGVTIVSGGNPNLDPEKADTYTVGFVFRPVALPGFDVSVDWLQVSLEDAIESLSAQQIADGCYVNGDVDQCAFITRDATQITFINQTQQNLSKAKIKGIDAEIGYARPITLFGGNERFGIRLFASWLDENSRTNSAGVKTDSVGSVTAQLLEWKATAMLNYSNGPFRWNMQARYLDGGLLSTAYNAPNATTGQVTTWNVADNTVGSVTYFDTRVAYEVPVGEGSMELYANVNNLFDRDPPLVLAEFGGLFANGGQYSSGYDVLGRRYSVGVSFRF